LSLPLTRPIPYTDPVAIFARFAATPYALFLDSALPDARLGRYAFIATDPFLTLTTKNGTITLQSPGSAAQTFSGDPFEVLREQVARYPAATLPGLPPFQTGVAGYWGYDLSHHLERLPRPTRDDLNLPDLALGFYDRVIAFDQIERRAWVIVHGDSASAEARLAELCACLATPFEATNVVPSSPFPLQPISNFTQAAYESAVQRVIDYIYAGDIYQANLAQRFQVELPLAVAPFDLYQRLRYRNPAPFAAYFNFGEGVLASASPERFLRVNAGQVETRPIKGTRPRGATPAADEQLRTELAASEKDRAENLMIVDLMRNDLSRVCRDHSVTVPELCAVESYATVHHLVSTVLGVLRPGFDAIDLLRATFPGGSITGAPKIRAMEIIAELEPVQRGPYCGALGYLGFDGTLDTNIVIRTYVIRGSTLTFHVGGGIVADSDPGLEYNETLVKAKALIATLGAGDH